MPNSRARVVIVDDHKIVRDGLRLLLREAEELDIVGVAGDSESAWTIINEMRPDIVVMDLDLPGEGGSAVTARLQQDLPDVKVVVLTGHAEQGVVQAVLRAGARGVLFKCNAGTELVQAIRTVRSGGVYLCMEAATLAAHGASGVSPEMEALSERERDVLRRVADGQSTKEIAFALQISPKTVDAHRAKLMSKLNVNSVAGLTKYAVRIGLSKI